MKFKPHEILKKFGFNIDEQGLFVGPADAYLYNNAFELIGKAISIDLSRISDDEIRSRFKAMAVFARSDKDAQLFLKSIDESTEATRGYLETILRSIYTPACQSGSLPV